MIDHTSPAWTEADQAASEPDFYGKWEGMETAPKDGDEILLYSNGDIGVCYWRDDHVMTGWTWGLDMPFNNPSHWMRLPEPPKETNQ